MTDLGVTKEHARRVLGLSRAEMNGLLERGELHVMQLGHYRRIPRRLLHEYASREFVKQLVYHCVRVNTSLEDLHAGRFPQSDTDDLSDIRVVGPHGEVPWNAASRFGDTEMKRLMKEIVNNVFTILFADDPIRLPTPKNWDEPEIVENLTAEGVKRVKRK